MKCAGHYDGRGIIVGDRRGAACDLADEVGAADPVSEISELLMLVMVASPLAPWRIELVVPSIVMVLVPVPAPLALVMVASPAVTIWLTKLVPPPVCEISEPSRLLMVAPLAAA